LAGALLARHAKVHDLGHGRRYFLRKLSRETTSAPLGASSAVWGFSTTGFAFGAAGLASGWRATFGAGAGTGLGSSLTGAVSCGSAFTSNSSSKLTDGS